jgi:hypothetical protein
LVFAVFKALLKEQLVTHADPQQGLACQGRCPDQGCRVTVDEAVPVWLEPDAELVAALVAVKLLDKVGRLPVRSWNSWFGPAAGRRDTLRDRWRRANAKRAARIPRGNDVGTATPVRPSGRTVRTVRQDVPNARETVQGTNGRRDVPLAELSTPPLGYVASKTRHD